MRILLTFNVCLSLIAISLFKTSLGADPEPASTSNNARFAEFFAKHCFECHQGEESAAGLDLSQLSPLLDAPSEFASWGKIHDMVAAGSMPLEAKHLDVRERADWVQLLHGSLDQADYQDVVQYGRGPIRRLNRSEYEQNLRDLLHLPHLDIKDLLPEDRESFHFNKSAETLDMTRVQLTAYLDAAASALRQATAASTQPRSRKHFRALATNMFPKAVDHAGRESSFFAKNSRMVPLTDSELAMIRRQGAHDPEMEVAIFRSASWPYYGYPEEFVAEEPGVYHVRFSARAVRQLKEFRLVQDTAPLAMTFRARKRSKADVSGDVRAVGGLLDIQPEEAVYETTVLLKEQETIEYSLMGLPVPFPITSHGGPLYYDFPPMPEAGHRGIAFRWLEIEGPIDVVAEESWPSSSHQLLFGDLPIRDVQHGRLGIEVLSEQPRPDAMRLIKEFASRAARRPMQESSLDVYHRLIFDQLEAGNSFVESMLVGYQAVLCSSHFLYLREPGQAADQYDLASRLSHFLGNTRPDAELERAAVQRELSNAESLRRHSDRLIDAPNFENFIHNFTDYWLDLKHVKRDAPDIRLYPEYRFDDYLIESMERETRAFVTTVIRENLPITTLIDADFVMVNDKLAKHYELGQVAGSAMRKLAVPESSVYGGLITQASILKVTSNGTTTSPVIRGAWIMDRLLGDPPPPPPDKVPAIAPDIRGATTIREQIMKHAHATECAGCHAKFDPVGFALENFDILGGYRERYRSLEKGDEVTGIDRAGHTYSYRIGQAVDAHGQLLDGGSFNDVRELKQLLLAKPRKLAANLLGQWVIYATGTPPRFSDRREINEILDKCDTTGYRIRDLLHELIQSRIFTGAARVELASTSTRK